MNDYATMSNAVYKSQFCPKPNHIKPCWCRGNALCAAIVDRRKCKRTVVGVVVRCWQHRETDDESR